VGGGLSLLGIDPGSDPTACVDRPGSDPTACDKVDNTSGVVSGIERCIDHRSSVCGAGVLQKKQGFFQVGVQQPPHPRNPAHQCSLTSLQILLFDNAAVFALKQGLN